MNHEWKVASFELSKRLVELGVVLDTEKYLVEDRHGTWLLFTKAECGFDIEEEYIPAPDVAELGKILCGFDFVVPVPTSTDYNGDWWFLSPKGSINLGVSTEAQARCAALIWLIENDYIRTEDVKL